MRDVRGTRSSSACAAAALASASACADSKVANDGSLSPFPGVVVAIDGAVMGAGTGPVAA